MLDTRMIDPKFSVTYACPDEAKTASDYLRDRAWVRVFKGTVKGVSTAPINDDLMGTANRLAACIHSQLALHVVERVAESRRDHFTIGFARDNIPSLAAGMCLSGHIVKDIDNLRIDERLLDFPNVESGNRFKVVKGNLAQLEGCYLYFDELKFKWIRSGKTSGNGKDACFEGRGKTTNQTRAARIRCGCTGCIVSTRRGDLTVLESKRDTLITWLCIVGWTTTKGVIRRH